MMKDSDSDDDDDRPLWHGRASTCT
jgi:hypothetical protein